jgi:hypothetical protein
MPTGTKQPTIPLELHLQRLQMLGLHWLKIGFSSSSSNNGSISELIVSGVKSEVLVTMISMLNIATGDIVFSEIIPRVSESENSLRM